MIVNSSGRLYPDDSDNLYIFGIIAYEYLNTKTGRVTPLNIRFRDEDKTKVAFPYAFSQPFIDDDESIWMGMYNIGFIHYSRRTKKTVYYTLHDSKRVQANNVYVIQRNATEKNLLWLATDNGIYSFNKNTKQLKRNFTSGDSNASPDSTIAIMNMEAGKDTIWFTVPGSGMGCYDIKKGVYTIFNHREEGTGKLAELDINFFQRRNEYEYYISEDDQLPGVFNTITHKYSFAARTSENLPAIQLRHFVADNSGNLWSLVFYQLYQGKYNTNRLRTFKLPINKSANKLENAFKTAVWDKTKKCYYTVFDSRNEVFVLDSNLKLIKTIPVESAITRTNTRSIVNPQIGTGTSPSVNSGKQEEANIFDMGLDENGKLWLCGHICGLSTPGQKKSYRPNLNPTSISGPKVTKPCIQKRIYVFTALSNPTCNAIYRVNIKQLTCDSILLPGEILNDSSGINQADKKMDVLQIDKNAKFAYFCYNRTVFQFDLHTKKAKKVVTMKDQEKLFQHFFNMFWYLLDDKDNIWVF